jgi:hypothetical protein
VLLPSEKSEMNQTKWPANRAVGVLPKTLSDLAHECESLVMRDLLLPPSLTRALVDVATALREEADRRGQD